MLIHSIVKLTASVSVVAASIGLGAGYTRYTRPDLTGRSTRELQLEAVSLSAPDRRTPTLVRLPAIQRQAFICDELSRRMSEQVLVWQAEEAVEEMAAERQQQLAARAEPD